MRRLFCLTGLLIASGVEAATVTNQFRLANWSGAAYSKDQSKAFDRCAATMSGEKGTAISYSFNHQLQWNVTLSNPAWSFVKGASLKVAMKIGDAKGSMVANAIAIDRTVLEIQTRDPILLLSRLRVARALWVAVGGITLEFSVDNGDRVLAALTQCVVRATRSRPSAGKSIFDGRDGSSSSEEAAALVSNIISYAGVADSRTLSNAESPGGLSIDVAWKAGPVTAGLTVLETEIPIEQLPHALVEQPFRTCRGEGFFVTFADTIGQSPVARVLITCQTPDATTSLYRLAIPRPKGGFYVANVISTGSAFSGLVQKAADEYEDRIRSVIMVAINKLE